MDSNELKYKSIRNVIIAISAVMISAIGGCTGWNLAETSRKVESGDQYVRALEAGADPIEAACALRFSRCNDLMLVNLRDAYSE